MSKFWLTHLTQWTGTAAYDGKFKKQNKDKSEVNVHETAPDCDKGREGVVACCHRRAAECQGRTSPQEPTFLHQTSFFYTQN